MCLKVLEASISLRGAIEKSQRAKEGSQNLARGLVPTGSSDSIWGLYPEATDGMMHSYWHAGDRDWVRDYRFFEIKNFRMVSHNPSCIPEAPSQS